MRAYADTSFVVTLLAPGEFQHTVELPGEILFLLLGELKADRSREARESEPQVAGVLAGHLPAPAGVIPRKGVRVGEGQLGLAHAAESLHRHAAGCTARGLCGQECPLHILYRHAAGRTARAHHAEFVFPERMAQFSVSSRTRPTKAGLCLSRLFGERRARPARSSRSRTEA